ncbi:MAG TPA: thioredoxin fold domain-containing protein [Sulfuricurvum sp.]|nr:thioredoxin fold domain-containing protein [Sulfuricurvum sp.]
MKKALLAILGTASMLMANDAIIAELSSLNIIQDNQINILKIKDEGNVYLVKGEPMRPAPGQPKTPFDFYVTKDKKIIIMGNAIYTDSKERVSFPMDKNILIGKEAFSYGTGNQVLYAFTDPECPYCKKFEKTMATLKDKYTFKIYLFPLPFHTEAIPMSKWILKGKNANEMGERLIALANGSEEYKKLVLSADDEKELMNIIDKQKGIAQEAEIRATPTVLDSNFNKINWQGL